MTLQLRVYVPSHPLIKHWLAVARDASTPPVLFRAAMAELGRWLTYEAARDWLPTLDVTVETPLADCPATLVNGEAPIAVVPVLRAGLTLLKEIEAVVPSAAMAVYHVGFARDEATLEASCYLNKLPDQFTPQTRVLITEPVLATGGTTASLMEELTERGVAPNLVRIISVVAAPPALQKLGSLYPDLSIYTAGIDEILNKDGLIVPGLGDAGDRAFST